MAELTKASGTVNPSAQHQNKDTSIRLES